MKVQNSNPQTQDAAKRHARHHPFRVRDGQSELSAAKEWLTELLSVGPVYGADCELIAFHAGLPWAILERAKFDLGVTFRDLNRESDWKCWSLWCWVLPDYLRPKHHNDNDFGDDEDDEDPGPRRRRRRRSARRDDADEDRAERELDDEMEEADDDDY